MNCDIIDFAKYCPRSTDKPADEANAKANGGKSQKEAEIIQFGQKFYLCGHTLFLNF